MKRVLFSLMMLIVTLTALADDYAYLTFETIDGDKVSVAVADLTISISGTTLTAGSQSFTLTNLSKMYFSTSDETSGIESLTIDDLNEITDVYDLSGKKVRKDQMRKGVYIVKSKKGTFKMAVK